jgi:glutamate-1-semialdehyde 2,1-aminomutase
VHFVRAGSLFWLSLHDQGAPRTAEVLPEAGKTRFAQLFHGMLARRVYLPPSAYEACFLSLAWTSPDIDRLAGALAETLATLV